MGVVLSCLGLSSVDERSQEEDEHRNLLDDRHASYGVFTDQTSEREGHEGEAADAGDVLREMELLRAVVGDTSSYVSL